jgi:hypothetical protein
MIPTTDSHIVPTSNGRMAHFSLGLNFLYYSMAIVEHIQQQYSTPLALNLHVKQAPRG